MKIMIRIWNITANQNIELDLNGSSSLDVVTRQLPDGYYSTFRTYGKCRRVLGFKAHLRRLYEPVTSPDVNASFLRSQLAPLLEYFLPNEARVRLIMTRLGKVYVAAEPLKPLLADVYENGVRVETTQIQRELPRLKSTAFIGASDSERKHIAQEGIIEALLARNGKILEGMTSNFFYVKDNILYTAQHNILLGVTRRTVIHLARGRGVDVKYQPLKQNQLSTVDEAFITSSSRGVVPVIKIDEARVGQGTPGQITRMLRSAYDKYVISKAERI
jgi:branched-chain amino acid aminotransferase